MDDTPYTTPDEDPFNVRPLLQQPRRRRSSMLDKWIKEQQVHPSSSGKPSDATNDARSITSVNPYLAYPDLARISLERNRTQDDASTINSYDLLEDEDIPPNTTDVPQMPATPTAPRSRRHSKNLLTPTSFRSFSISFRSASPAVPPSPNDSVSPRRLARMSLFTRSSHPSPGTVAHQRSSSLTTTPISESSHPSNIQIAEAGSSRWRPSVLGHFSQTPSSPSVVLSEPNFRPSRPSVSSADTFRSQTSATTPDSYSSYTPSKPSFPASIRSRNRSHVSMFHSRTEVASSNTVSSQNPVVPRDSPIDASYIQSGHVSRSSSTLPSRVPFGPKPGSYLDNFTDLDDEEENDVRRSADKYPTKTKALRPSIAYSSGGTLSRVTFSSLSSRGQKKKKKLVVSGVGNKDVRKFEGVKRWCENFGEVRQITRMPNGDLHVDFLRADVADTVCRLRAGVYIAGVGSVQLSWFSGDKR